MYNIFFLGGRGGESSGKREKIVQYLSVSLEIREDGGKRVATSTSAVFVNFRREREREIIAMSVNCIFLRERERERERAEEIR